MPLPHPATRGTRVRWQCTATDGVWKGSVDVPGSLEARPPPGSAEFLVLRKDSLDVEFIEAWRLQPSSRLVLRIGSRKRERT